MNAPTFRCPALVRRLLTVFVVTGGAAGLSGPAGAEEVPAGKALRALMITGGCCHDYEQQKVILSEGISQRANVEWTIVHEGGTSKDHKVALYGNPGWTKGYDVIVHNECFGGVKDDDFVEALAKAHLDTPAVVLHCTMHSYRSAERGAEEWRKFLGVTSLPTGKHLCVWVNEYGPQKSRVFGTTVGHHNETMAENTYLDLVTRGLLWAVGKLTSEGKPAAGYGANRG